MGELKLWFIFKLKSEFKKIKDSFKSQDFKIKELENKIVPEKEIKLLIENAILKAGKIEKVELREPIPRTTRTPQTKIRKKGEKLLDKVEIMAEIGSMLKQGLSTTEMYDIIVNEKEMCKKTCFYNYLKNVREPTPRTTRTPITN